MAGLINWRKVAIPTENPDVNHVYVGVDIADSTLYVKDSVGVVTKYPTTLQVTSLISAALLDYDESSVVDTKISNAISALINGAPTVLDQLNELSAAINNDPNYYITVNNALALKYDASNPSGYETPAQLDARDTANRSRTNHTGTQLSSTISDFLTAVLATVLTGISFATSTAVTAADTILQAIGKLQAQINLLVFGLEYEYFEDLSPFSTNSGTNQIAAQFQKTFTAGRQYRVNIQYNFTLNSTSNSVFFGLYVDGTLRTDETQVELKDATDNLTHQIFCNYLPTTTGLKNIELRTRTENGSTVTVAAVRCDVWRVA